MHDLRHRVLVRAEAAQDVHLTPGHGAKCGQPPGAPRARVHGPCRSRRCLGGKSPRTTALL
jgi:hypothetical protein